MAAEASMGGNGPGNTAEGSGGAEAGGGRLAEPPKAGKENIPGGWKEL